MIGWPCLLTNGFYLCLLDFVRGFRFFYTKNISRNKKLSKSTAKKLTHSRNDTMKPLIVLTLLVSTLLMSISVGRCYGQTATSKPSHLTISELEAKKALKYKADAEYFWAVGMQKDSIIGNQSTIIKKQKRKLFWQKTALIVQSSIFIYLIIKTQ